MPSRHTLLLPLLLATSPQLLPAQVETPATPLASSRETYSSVNRVLEAGDGSLIVLDWRTNELWRVAADLQSQQQISRTGDGPGEVRRPSQIALARPGLLLIWDGAARRFTRCDLLPATSCRTLTPDSRIRPFLMDGVDSAGRIATIVLPPPTQGPPSASVSMTLVRLSADASAADTMGILASPPTYQIVQTRVSGNNTSTNTMNMPIPFVSGDQSAVTANGRVVILSADGTVLRYPGGRDVAVKPSRPAAPYTTRERDSLLRYADSVHAGESMRKALPDVKGSLLPRSLVASPRGPLWFGVYDVSASTDILYDVVGEDGKRRGTVRLKPSMRLVGVGRDRYFVTQRDDDDLLTIHAFAMPKWAAQ
jgi:hypothetical protein